MPEPEVETHPQFEEHVGEDGSVSIYLNGRVLFVVMEQAPADV